LALSPLNSTEARAIRINKITKPSKTYALDLETGTMDGVIDGLDAIKQFIRKAIATPRYRFMIYDGQYGCELDSFIGQDMPLALLRSNIPRIIREALIYDDRIRDVHSFEIRLEEQSLYVSFAVSTELGTISQEVTI